MGVAKKQNKQYKLCDFCKKIKHEDEIEEIVVVYHKCKECKDITLSGQTLPIDKGDSVEQPKKVFAPRPVKPPPYLAEAFAPPEEFKPAPAPLQPPPTVRSTEVLKDK